MEQKANALPFILLCFVEFHFTSLFLSYHFTPREAGPD